MKTSQLLVLLAASVAVVSAAIAADPACTPTTCLTTEDCVLKQVQCIRAPCPPVPTCVPKATTTKQTSNVCTPGFCPDSEVCVAKQVQCFTTPCPPIPTCMPQQPMPRTCVIKCHAFQRCYFYNGAPYCADVCAPGRCKKGETCELQRVQCLVAPCPRVAVCKPM